MNTPSNTSWSTFRSKLCRYVGFFVKDPDDREDVVQDVLVRLSQRTSDQSLEESTSAWVFRVAHNAAMDFHKKSRRRKKHEDHAARTFTAADNDTEREEELERIRSGLNACILAMSYTLDEKHKQALHAVDLHHLKNAEAAKAQNVSLSAFKTRLRRARKDVRALVSECCELAIDGTGRIFDHSCKKDCACQANA